jgi:hypothetical protein
MPPALLDSASPTFAIYNAGPPSWQPTTVTSPFPAPAAFENTGLVTSFRCYDRTIKASSPAGPTTLYAWQGQHIFGLTAPPAWTLALTVASQSSLVQFGLHTGLYLVDASDGSGAYICGLFFATAIDQIGWVKYNLATGAWSQGTVSGMGRPAAPATMSTCVVFQGKLAHANYGRVTFFDPLTNQITQADYSTAIGGSTPWAKLRVANGRLFVVDTGAGSTVAIGEFLFGGVVPLTTLPTAIFGGSEPFSPPLTPNTIWAQYEQPGSEPGGQGLRLFQYNVTSSVPGTPLPAPFDAVGLINAGMIPPVGTNQASELRWSADNGHTATAGGVSSIEGYLFNRDSLSTIFTKANFWGASWNGVGPFALVQFPTLDPTTMVFPTRWSRIASPWGCAEHLAPASFTQMVSFESYQDGTVARGMLVKFRFFTAGGTQPRVRFLYGRALNPVGGAIASLSVGDGIPIGGTLSLDAGDDSLFSVPVDNGSTLYQIIWDLDADGVPDDEWVVFRPVGFTPGFETAGLLEPGTCHSFVTLGSLPSPPDVNDKQIAGPPQQIQALSDASTPQTAGPPQQIQALSDSSVKQTAGPPQQIQALSDSSVKQTAGPPQQITAEADYFGKIAARVPARAHSQPGWVNFQLDGADQGGDQQNVNLLDSASDPTEPRGSQTGAPFTGDVKAVASFELGALDQVGALVTTPGIDLTAPADTTLFTVPSGFELIVFGASVRCEAATAISSPATARIGFNGPASNLFSAQLLVALTAQDDAYDYPVGGESVIAPAGSVIVFRVDAGATGTSQSGEVSLFGYLRRS